MQKKVRLEFYFIESAEIRYGWGYVLLKMVKGTAGNLFCRKCKSKVWLEFSFIENAKIWSGIGRTTIKMLK